MKLAILKKVRVFLSLLFFILTLFVFVDFAAMVSSKMVNAVLYLQFIPSFLEFIGALTLASAGFLFIAGLTLLFGRVYCSSVCPLGTIFDISLWIRNRFRTKKFRFKKAQSALRYSLLAIGIFLVFFGNLLIFNLLDPFGISGKIFSNLARLVYYIGNDLLALFLQLFDNYYFYLVPVKYVHFYSFLVSLGILATLVIVSMLRGRLFCNTVCPAGSMLGLLSNFSLFRLKIDEEHCTSCGLCTRDCKAECIDFKKRKIDFSRCIACYNCISACPEDVISYRLPDKLLNGKKDELQKNEVPASGGFDRRSFLKTTIIGTGSILTANLAFSKNSVQGVSQHPVTPPGSLSIWHYTSKCVSCHLCVSVCPTHVLQPTLAAFGITGLLQPRMDYHTNFCNYECVKCTEVCPSGAITLLTKEQKETVQLGVSKFIKNLCIVVEKHTACGACSEHCPTKAVEMVPYLDNLKIPAVDEKICVGCGACEYACPTKPDKAIYVESNLYHRKAMKPMKKTGEIRKVNPADDFPF